MQLEPVENRMMTTAQARRGFTMVELLLSLIVTAIVGAALVRMVTSQARFMDQQEAWRSARSVARGGINRLLSDMRVVEARGGVWAAVAGGQDFTLNVPYAFGIICSMPALNQAVVSMLPVDAQMYAAAGHTGFAIRATDNATYTYYTSQAAPAAANVGQVNTCTAPALPDLAISTGALLALNGSPNGQVLFLQATANFNPTPKKGEIVFLYRRIRYQFKNSTLIPGRTGLFRTTVTNNVEEEIATPFANTARVNFYVLNNANPQAAVPGALSDIRGFELVLDGMSERAPQGSAAPKTANVRTSVFFENRPD
jgi:prepilin-type N-terminal cleavage/methylation domain-containing protein